MAKIEFSTVKGLDTTFVFPTLAITDNSNSTNVDVSAYIAFLKFSLEIRLNWNRRLRTVKSK